MHWVSNYRSFHDGEACKICYATENQCEEPTVENDQMAREPRYEDGQDNLEPIAQVSCGVAAGVVAALRLQKAARSSNVCFSIHRQSYAELCRKRR